MFSTTVIWAAWTLFMIQGCADAVPFKTDHELDDPLDCHLPEDYSTEWFLNNTKPEFRQPLENNALFYSAGMSASARRIAENNSKVTIWDVWPCYLYNHIDEHHNPLRCIHQNVTSRSTFFAHMSRAFARKARNASTVLHSCKNYPRPPMDGIWGTVEFPTLQQNGGVDFLEKINENKSLSEIFWRRPRAPVESLWEENLSHGGDLKRRQDDDDDKDERSPPPLPPHFHKTCMSPKQLEFFDDVQW